jgi:AraC-like DNA-binding protein
MLITVNNFKKDNNNKMIYDIFPPSETLQGIVKQYLVINSLDGIEEILFLPNGCNFIVFNRGVKGYSKVYNGDGKYDMPKKYSISVKTNKVKSFVFSNSTVEKVEFPIIFTELTPVGYYILFNKQTSDLKITYQELEDDIVEAYFKDLYTHSNIQEELEYLNTSLNELKLEQNTPHVMALDVIDEIINTYRFEVTVEHLAKEFGCSRSTLERQFKTVVGLTPKNFIFVAKFCKTVLAYINDKATFNELEYLYSDNSHMNAVFKKFLGVGPSVLLSEVAKNNLLVYQAKKD